MKKKRSKKNQEPSCWNRIGVWGDLEQRCERLEDVVHCRNCEVFSQAGRSVFDRRPPAGYMSQWSKDIALPQDSSDKKNVGVIIFRIGMEWFALQANILQEITGDRTVHSIPRNETSEIAGVVNIGGEVRICYSLSNLLGIEQDCDQDTSIGSRTYRRLIIVVIDDSYYVFQACEVIGLYRYGVEELLPVPTTLEKNQASLLSGLFKYDDHIIALLNTDQVQHSLLGVSA